MFQNAAFTVGGFGGDGCDFGSSSILSNAETLPILFLGKTLMEYGELLLDILEGDGGVVFSTRLVLENV